MIREREEESSEEAPSKKRGPAARKRYEKGACPPLSVYQFFVLEKDLDELWL